MLIQSLLLQQLHLQQARLRKACGVEEAAAISPTQAAPQVTLAGLLKEGEEQAERRAKSKTLPAKNASPESKTGSPPANNGSLQAVNGVITELPQSVFLARSSPSQPYNSPWTMPVRPHNLSRVYSRSFQVPLQYHIL